MSRQRFIHPDIWTDPTLGQLNPMERLFFIGCFSNADDEGRLLGNPAYLRSTIFPYDDITIEEIKEMRDHVVSICKNLLLYEVDGLEYMAFSKWDKYQKPKYPKPSKFPSPADEENRETFPQNSGKVYPEMEKASVPRLGLDRDGMGRDGASASNSDANLSQDLTPLPEHTENEREILKELRDVKKYPFEFLQDLGFIRSLAVDFPSLNLLTEAKKWRTYKRDKPLTANSNPRLQFRNWCEKAAQWQQEKGINSRASPANRKPEIDLVALAEAD